MNTHIIGEVVSKGKFLLKNNKYNLKETGMLKEERNG